VVKNVIISNYDQIEFYKYLIENQSPKSYLRNLKINKLLRPTELPRQIDIDVSYESRLLIPLHGVHETPTEISLKRCAALGQRIIINLEDDYKTISDISIEFEILATPMGKILNELKIDSVELVPVLKPTTGDVIIRGFYFRELSINKLL
jgi:hypothetical protein